MKRLVSTIGLPKEEWLKYRKQGMCGSDAGAIAGMNPYVSAFSVYQDKIADAIKEIPDNEAMKQGRDLEEYVAKRFSEETGLKVKRAYYIFQNEKYNWMLADFDRLIVGRQTNGKTEQCLSAIFYRYSIIWRCLVMNTGILQL